MAFKDTTPEVVSRTKIVPPPVGGWNTKDPLVTMDAMYAVEMENYFPGFGSVDLVNGYRYYSSGIGSGAVVALAELYTGSTRKLVACGSDNHIYSCNSGGAATDLGAGGSATPWLYTVQFKNLIFISNGVASLRSWDGAAGATTDSGAILGLPTAGTRAMGVYKGRLYGTLGTTSVWFTALDSTTVFQSVFDFSSLLKYGGNITFIGSITRAKDFNEDVLFCIITDQGEILVYQGEYPSAANWSILGQYFIPRPMGPKAFYYIGANLCIITNQGTIPMSSIMGGTSDGRYLTMSDNITSAFTAAASTTLLNDTAWCGVNYPRGNFAVNNIPVTSGAVSNQFIMNTTTQAWCKRTNQNAFSWAVFNDELYFGGLNGKVFKADNGYFDEDPSNTGAVLSRSTKLRPAYNYMDNPESVKTFTEAQVFMYESEGLDITVDADIDYANRTATSQNIDTSKGTSYQFYNNRVGLTGIGNAASIRFDGTVTTKRRSIQALKVYYKEGGIR